MVTVNFILSGGKSRLFFRITMKKITCCLLLFCASIVHSEMAEHSDLHHLQENPQLIESFLSENIYQLTAEQLLTLIKIYQTVPQFK